MTKINHTNLQYMPEQGIAGKFVDTAFDGDGILAGIRFHHENTFNFAFDIVDAIAEKTPDKHAMLHISNNKEEKIFTFGDKKSRAPSGQSLDWIMPVVFLWQGITCIFRSV